MNLYEINEELEKAFEAAVDPETGEINEEAKARFDELELLQEQKRENIALYIKNINAEYDACKKEKDAFARKMDALENRRNWLKQYLRTDLNGEKFKTTKVNIYYQTSKSIELDEGVEVADMLPVYIRIAEPELNKAAIKDALKRGEKVDGVHEVENVSMVIR